MKNLLRYFVVGLLILSTLPGNSQAQSLSVTTDTLSITSGTSVWLRDTIVNLTSAVVDLEWRVKATNFPGSWLLVTGLCDVCNCYAVDTTTPTTSLHNCNYPAGVGQYDFQADLTGLPGGCYYLTVLGKNTAMPTDTVMITYMVCVPATGVPNVSRLLPAAYPDPASSVLNLTYPASATGYEATICDISGTIVKAVSIPAGTEHTSLDIEEMPAGTYFMRLNAADGADSHFLRFSKR